MATASPTFNLISSEDVEGTKVCDPSGNRIGEIDHLMIDRDSGNVRYAIMSFGGFLGLGHSHYPVPWNALKYDTSAGGYVSNITEQQLKRRARVQRRQLDESRMGNRLARPLRRQALLARGRPFRRSVRPAFGNLLRAFENAAPRAADLTELLLRTTLMKTDGRGSKSLAQFFEPFSSQCSTSTNRARCSARAWRWG